MNPIIPGSTPALTEITSGSKNVHTTLVPDLIFEYIGYVTSFAIFLKS